MVGRDPLQAVFQGSHRLGSHTEPDDGPDLGVRRRARPQPLGDPGAGLVIRAAEGPG